jgi:hypothetical protein
MNLQYLHAPNSSWVYLLLEGTQVRQPGFLRTLSTKGKQYKNNNIQHPSQKQCSVLYKPRGLQNKGEGEQRAGKYITNILGVPVRESL